MTDEELFAAWTAQAQFEGVKGTNRELKAAPVVNALGRLLEYQRREKAREKLKRLPDEREAIQRLICTEDENGCREIVALRRNGWVVECSICDRTISINIYGGKQS